MAELNFKNEQILICNENEYPHFSTIVSYENLQNHRWISILILNNLCMNYKIDKKKFFKFITSTNNRILGNIITIENIDLSYSELHKGLGNYNLCQANLAHSTFHGSFYGTQFCEANLTFCKIKQGTKFINVDFTKADFSNMKIILEKDVSPFVAHFIDCIFTECKLINANLTETDLALSKFYNVDFSGTILHYANISLANITNVTINDKTNTKSINLLSKGHYYEWEDVRNNKELIKLLLEAFDKNNFDKKFKDKILQDNSDYDYKNDKP